jgi:glycosyltransferase involved in cell wall biosynthesis
MRRLAIVEYLMSAGGLERVLRGLARAFLEIPEARDWDITLLLARYNSAHRRCEWPEELSGPRLRVEWLGQSTATSRLLDSLAHAQGIRGIPLSKPGGALLARAARGSGPPGWRAWLGDPRTVVGRASRRFDLLYFPYPVDLAPPEVAVPVVITPQDFNFKHYSAVLDPGQRRQERVTRAWLDRAERILLTTDAVRAELARFYPEHAAKAGVVRLGVTAPSPGDEPSSATLEEFRRARALPEAFVLMAGWVLEHKNQHTLVEALRRLRERGVRLPAVFVGPNAENLVEARELGFPQGYAGQVREALARADFVHGRDFFTLGYVSDAEIQLLYRLATVFVLPSLYEGFGLPSLESLAAGCPTIVSSIPPLEEQNRLLGGLLPAFDPRDAAALADRIAWVLDHPADARAAARLGRQRVADVYDWRKTARAYLSTFAEVIDARGGATAAAR